MPYIALASTELYLLQACVLRCRVNGNKVLSGPGLAGDYEPGMMIGGGIHAYRIRAACFAIAEDREWEFYSAFRAAVNSKVETARRAFTREQCIAIKYCTGEEDERRYVMEGDMESSTSDDSVKDDSIRGRKRKKKKSKKKKTKKKRHTKKKRIKKDEVEL